MFCLEALLFNSDHQCTQVLISAHPIQYLLFPILWIVTNLLGMKYYFILVLICISLWMVSDVRNPFMCLLTICILKKYFLSLLSIFELCCFELVFLVADHQPLFDIAGPFFPVITGIIILFDSMTSLFAISSLPTQISPYSHPY